MHVKEVEKQKLSLSFSPAHYVERRINEPFGAGIERKEVAMKSMKKHSPRSRIRLHPSQARQFLAWYSADSHTSPRDRDGDNLSI